MEIKEASLLRLVGYLIEQGERFSRVGDLEDHWPEFSGRNSGEVPARNAIDQGLHRLRKALTRLGITIENVRNSGWRLREERKAAFFFKSYGLILFT